LREVLANSRSCRLGLQEVKVSTECQHTKKEGYQSDKLRYMF